VRAILPNTKSGDVGGYDLIPGQYAPVRLILGEDANALLIPRPALVESQIGKQVFVVNAENKVEVRNVEVGRSYQNQWIIQKGLKKGEKVIVEGTQKVQPGGGRQSQAVFDPKNIVKLTGIGGFNFFR